MFKQIFLIAYVVMLVVGVLITLDADRGGVDIAIEQYEAEYKSIELENEIEALYIELERLGETVE